MGEVLVGGNEVSLLLHKTLEKVLAAQSKSGGSWRFLPQLRRLKVPTEYLENLKDEAGGIVVRMWLEALQNELNEINSYVAEWSESREKRWQMCVCLSNKLQWDMHVNSRLQHLGHRFQPTLLASCLERLVSEVRDLATTGGRAGAGTLENSLAQIQLTAIPDRIGEIQTLLTQGPSGLNLSPNPGSEPPRSSEPVTHLETRNSFPDEVFGGNDTLEKVIAEIFHSTHRKCVGLWGTGGAGKTFTAGRVFHDPRVQSYFDGPRRQIWVTASKQSRHAVMKEIFVKLRGNGDDFPDADDVYSVRSTLKKQLNLDKVFLVIDDVSAADQLDFLDLVMEPQESERRVVTLVTTRNEKILERKRARIVEVLLLTEDESWEMFSRCAFGQAEEVSSEIRDAARAIAAECKGLPLALKVVGSGLVGERDLQLWESALKRLRDASMLSGEYEETLAGWY